MDREHVMLTASHQAYYRRFIELFPETGINGYKLLSPYTEQDCCITFAKVYDPNSIKKDREVEKKYWKYGIDIDVFPTDGVPSTEEDCKKFFRQQYMDFHLFRALVGGMQFNDAVPKKMVKILYTSVIKVAGKLKLLKEDQICMRINERAERYKVADSEKIAVSVFPHYGNREVVGKDGFLNQVTLNFEGEMFTAPSNYDEYLTSLYGDYMKLPSRDKQKTHHLSVFYRK